MDNREWMYTGWRNKRDYSAEFERNMDAFSEKAFEKGQHKALCPCTKCENTKYQSRLNMGKHIVVHGFVKNYTRWICHGKAHRVREEVLRQCIETFDAEAGCGDTIKDFHQGNFDKGFDQVMDEAPEPTAKAYYNMLSSGQKPLHEHTDVS
jgi:hypothetical protein